MPRPERAREMARRAARQRGQFAQRRRVVEARAQRLLDRREPGCLHRARAARGPHGVLEQLGAQALEHDAGQRFGAQEVRAQRTDARQKRAPLGEGRGARRASRQAFDPARVEFDVEHVGALGLERVAVLGPDRIEQQRTLARALFARPQTLAEGAREHDQQVGALMRVQRQRRAARVARQHERQVRRAPLRQAPAEEDPGSEREGHGRDSTPGA